MERLWRWSHDFLESVDFLGACSQVWVVLFLITTGSSLWVGCGNTYGPFEGPGSDQEVMEEAQYLIDQGECMKARDKLFRSSRTEDQLFVLGFSELCVAGATLENLGSTVVTYTSSSGTDYVVVGRLARKLLPYSLGKENMVDEALASFASISSRDRRAYTRLVAHLTKLAMIVARGTSGGTLTREDISASNSCTSSVACPAGGMTDTAAADFRNQVLAMAADTSGMSTSFSGLSDLSTALNNEFTSSSPDAIRYLVRTKVIPGD